MDCIGLLNMFGNIYKLETMWTNLFDFERPTLTVTQTFHYATLLEQS